jgi:hypothetical protein
MRAEYDIVENINTKEESREKNNRFLVKILSVLTFIIITIIFFSTTYHIAFNYFEGIQIKREAVENNNAETRKTYYIEQQIRRDVEKMQKNLN